MESPCIIGLVALGDEAWAQTGRWALTDEEQEELLARIDTSKSGTLDRKEFESFCTSAESRQWVLDSLPSSAHGLLCHSLISSAFRHFDENNDQVLDMKEWSRFLSYLAQLRLHYFQQMAFQGFRAYWGRGQYHDEYEMSLDDASQVQIRALVDAVRLEAQYELEDGISQLGKSFQIGLLVSEWQEWRADLMYYSSNNHPLHGIFSCDANNRLERLDRFFMEIATACYCFWMAHERRGGMWSASGDQLPPFLEHEQVYKIVCVTIPGIIIYYVLFFLFTTPCGIVDESSAHPEEVTKAHRYNAFGDLIGNVLVCSLIFICLWRLIFHNTGDALSIDLPLAVLQSRVLSYIFSWSLMLSLYFNPFVAWGSSKPKTTSLGDWIGLGQWVLERQKVQLTCLSLPEKSAAFWSAKGDARSCTPSLNNQLIQLCGLGGRGERGKLLASTRYPDLDAWLDETPR